MISQLIALAFVLVGAISLAVYGFIYRRKSPETRDYPVFKPLADEVGRAAEEGATIHVALGNGSLTDMDAMTSIAALQGLSGLLDLAATYDTPPIMTTADPTLYVLANDYMQRAYARLGNIDRYRPVFVQYTAASPATYAAMAATHLFDENVGANIMLGAFDQEVSLLTEAAGRKSVHSVGGTVSLEGLSALYPSLKQEHLAIGEELFAGGAVVTQHPTYWASLWAEDILRWLVVLGIITAAVLSVLGLGG